MCTCCEHPQRLEIDAALTAGTPHRDVAARFGLALASLSRHRAHIVARSSESTADALLRVYAAHGLELSPHDLLWADLEDVRWGAHPHDYPLVANLAHAMIAHLRPRVRAWEAQVRADDAIDTYDAHDVACDLSDLVDVLRSEVHEAPAGRPRSAVAGALASAEALLRRVGGAPTYTDAETTAQLAKLADEARQLRADFVKHVSTDGAHA